MASDRLNEGFTPYPAHRQMTAADAQIFSGAAEQLVWPELSAAIRAAGGDKANIAHFSREVCGGRPVLPWAAEHDADEVIEALHSVAEKLR